MRGASLAETNAFVAVLEQRSFTKAAKQLGLSPPRVSDMVRSLEERLGVRLVERTTRSVAPTTAGERLIERLRPVLDDYQAALDSTTEFRDTPAGTLRITVAPPAATFVLADAVPRFLALHPAISLDISVDPALADIVTGRFDAGIRHGEHLARDMFAVRISGDWPMIIAAAPAYTAEHGAPQKPQDLAAHDCICFLRSGAVVPWRFRMKGRTVEAHVTGRLTVNDIGIALKAVKEGVGLIQLPLPYVASELAEGKLLTLLDEWAPPPVQPFYLYYPSRRQNRPALKALVQFLQETQRHSSENMDG
jgi:DNA-binding transcriptional LysR family regulator